MTVNEFKAWLEGLSEGIVGSPTPEQWNKIKAKIDTLSSVKAPIDGIRDIVKKGLPHEYPHRWL